ncbi:MAG: NADH oxidoreductase (quinone) subunit F [Candidatus Wallbacteria bacterium GWC2_49_35]|uniref:NADH-quinone oxidoreductase subunit F n=1 Tax=Candidatus Wallbacteria bacterium GWC2_49_35 TaxID=1817813 RepID=A0A1F7WW88_9BACT|nr:MAG: NADH oxidoreductase (quinone) subunit F [Candidatus Wallbacteria bacterium GWC2_49_35]
MKLIVSKNFDKKDSYKIDTYIAGGGYEAVKKCLESMKPADIIEEIKKSGLRGRGGAGFPTGMKWSFVPKESSVPKYLAVNADEGEPGTFKDRQILELDPHLLLEGIMIACLAVGIHTAYIYIRGEYKKAFDRIEAAIAECYAKGFLGSDIFGSGYEIDIHAHAGAGAYICGEETGLIESLEGHRGQPRLKPPFPALSGLFAGPTVINNVETLACVPEIISGGAEKFAALGTPKNSGTRLFGVSGDVEKPGVYELELGISARKLIYDICGGVKGGGKLKGFIPGGLSAPIMTADELDTPLDFDSLAKAGSMAGSGGVIVISEHQSIPKIAARTADFYAHESCGQCTQCREGTRWVSQLFNKIYRGGGRRKDIDLILDVCSNMMGQTICVLSDACAMPSIAFIKKFRHEFEALTGE